MCIRIGRLPSRPPFSACVVDVEDVENGHANGIGSKRVSRRISNADILGFLDKPTSFYELYIRVTNKAIDLFVKAGRRKFALKLHGSLAALDLYVYRDLPESQSNLTVVSEIDILLLSRHIRRSLRIMHRIAGQAWNRICYFRVLKRMRLCRERMIDSGSTRP